MGVQPGGVPEQDWAGVSTELPAGYWPGSALRPEEPGGTFHKDSYEGVDLRGSGLVEPVSRAESCSGHIAWKGHRGTGSEGQTARGPGRTALLRFRCPCVFPKSHT